MNVFVTLIKKNLVESRWNLGLSAMAFFALSLLTAWRIQRFEHLVALGEAGPETRGYGMLKVFGGPNMDYSTTALQVCWWNHPVIILTVLGWAVTRGSAAVAGEIERGTIDLTLSRPVARWLYLTAQIVFAVFGLVLITSALIAGCLTSALIFTLKTPPSLWTLMKPGLMVVTLGMSVFGYTLPFSCLDVVRWRANLAASTITLAGLFSMSLANLFEGYSFHDLMERVSVFRAYAPVTVALKGEPLAYNATVLTFVFAAGVAVSYWLFSRRDLPSNS